MPRRNKTPKITKQSFSSAREGAKTRYPTKAAAEKAIQQRQFESINPIELYCYQGADGGWYLTSQPPYT